METVVKAPGSARARATGTGSRASGTDSWSTGPGSQTTGPCSRARSGPTGPGSSRSTDQPEAEPFCKVLVSGYPHYTHPKELKLIFSEFGKVTVDGINGKFATLTFSSEAEAKAARQASHRVNLYGKFLTVRKPGQDKPTTPKREFPRSKQNSEIVPAEQLQLAGAGDAEQQVRALVERLRLAPPELAALGNLYADVEGALQALWPGCKAVPFGSITTGLGIKSSDADCFIDIPPQFRHPNGNYVNKAKRVLQQQPTSFTEILAIPRANTPIVKFFHVPTQINCDVTFKTPLGTQNSSLIGFLLHADPRLIPMAIVIKYWAKVHGFSGTGKLTNYALTLMIIFYLQQPPLSLLPSVAWLQRDPSADLIVDHWNTGFLSIMPPRPSDSSTATVPDLLGGFFEYYSLFNFDEMVVCPYLGCPLKKEDFKDLSRLPDAFQRYKLNVLNQLALPLRFSAAMCVQDPFEQCHNVASAISGRLADEIRAFFKFAANAFEKEKSNECRGFLNTILLEKPKIVRTKGSPEFRVNLFPRIIVTIVNPDWKTVVREVVFIIFEKMLKLKLGKVEEKVNPDSKKEKEKYSGTVANPIWKRRLVKMVFRTANVDFVDKQTKITEEIIKLVNQAVNVQFQLTLTYCHDPKSAVVSIRMGNGEVEAFREFGKFFISVMQNWFTRILEPYMRQNPVNMSDKIAQTLQGDCAYSDGEEDDAPDDPGDNRIADQL